MNMSDVSKVLEKLAMKKIHVPICLWGPSGSAKTSAIRQLGQKLNYKVITVILSQKQAVDISGMPSTASSKYKVDLTLKDGTVEKSEVDVPVLDYHLPKWFMDALMEGNTILFFDELNRAKLDTLQAIFEPIIDKIINNQKLPDSVLIVAACNPPNKKYDTLPVTDNALVTRFCHILVEPSVEEFRVWGSKKNQSGETNIHPTMLSFAEAHGQKAFCALDDEDQQFPVKIKPNFRSAQFVSDFEYAEIDTIDKSVFAECIKGCLGSDASTLYLRHRSDMIRAITLEEVFALTEETIKKINQLSGKEQVPGSNSIKVQIDVISQTVNEIIENEEKCRPYMSKVLDFCELIPLESAANLIRSVYSKDNKWSEEILKRPKLTAQIKESKAAREKTQGEFKVD